MKKRGVGTAKGKYQNLDSSNIDIGRLDNLPAAEVFVAELKSQQEAATHAGKFFGPLDYWIGWAALLFEVVLPFR